MATIEERKKQLEARLAELDSRLHEIEDELDNPMPADWDDRASEREGDEVLEDLGTAGLQEMRMIQASLTRIEDGSYGYCTQCDEEILQERLDLLPHTPLCRKCANAMEKT